MQQKEKKEEEKNLIRNIKRKPIITKQKSKKMTLKELQKMIKEELDSYIGEADEVDVDVDTDAGDVDATDAGSDEDMLRNIYDMLKAKFEAEEDGDDMDDMDEADMAEDMVDEVKDDEKKDEAADMEERAAQGFGDPGNKKTSGDNVGYKTVGKLSEGVEEDKTALQERFQKLANIIK